MKKIFLLTALCFCAITASAQLNVQFHYDMGSALFNDELSTRPTRTATIENFTADKWGSTYFFVDGNFADNKVHSAYGELARELKFWKAPVAVHLEYNGGLAGSGSYNDAYLVGGAYNWANSNFSKTFSIQAMYKYLANQTVGTRHSWQITTVWGIHFAKGLCSFTGFTDLWHDNSVNGSLIFCSEPQFWFNFAPLSWVDDDFRLSLGTEVELSNNLVWTDNGKNNRFYAIPTLAAKWTFK